MPRNAVYQTVERFLRDKLGASAPKSVAISLSGGVDSMAGSPQIK